MTEPTGPHPPERYSSPLCSSWASLADLSPEIRDDASADDWEIALWQASELLWALSGRRWYGSGCTETAYARANAPGYGSWPYLESGCGCGGLNWDYPGITVARAYRYTAPLSRHLEPVAIQLPRRDVTAVTGVSVSGGPFTAYEFAPSGWLERTDGRGWDLCRDSMTVTYEWGSLPPLGGVRAAIVYAHELIKSLNGSDDCQLPEQVSSVTRQGISMSVANPMDFLTEGRTGVPAVDAWIMSVNPKSRYAPAGVWIPGTPTLTRGTP